MEFVGAVVLAGVGEEMVILIVRGGIGHFNGRSVNCWITSHNALLGTSRTHLLCFPPGQSTTPCPLFWTHKKHPLNSKEELLYTLLPSGKSRAVLKVLRSSIPPLSIPPNRGTIVTQSFYICNKALVSQNASPYIAMWEQVSETIKPKFV